MKVGDIVGRKSYGFDVSGDQPQAHLRGVSKRLYATADLSYPVEEV